MLLYTRRSRPIVDTSASSAASPGRGIGIGGRLELHGVGRCNGAGVISGIDSGGRVELHASADDGMSESASSVIAIDLVLRTSQYIVLLYDRKEEKIPKTLVLRGVVETSGTRMRSLRLSIAERLLQYHRKFGASRILDHLLLALALLPLVLVPICVSSSLCSTCARALHPR